jgi:hypothetical protein
MLTNFMTSSGFSSTSSMRKCLIPAAIKSFKYDAPDDDDNNDDDDKVVVVVMMVMVTIMMMIIMVIMVLDSRSNKFIQI